jgi:uncharacterized DUF497 family protein
VRISFDPAKDEWNIRVRGLSFSAAADFDFENALYAVDVRSDYGETRYVTFGMCQRRLNSDPDYALTAEVILTHPPVNQVV